MSAHEITMALVGQRQKGTFSFCIYCSAPCYGLACRGHRDLLAIDPNQYEMRLRGRNRESNEAAAVQTDSAAASSTEGEV